MAKLLLFLLIISSSICADNIKIINVSYENKATYPYYLGDSEHIDLKKPGIAIEAMQGIEKKLNIKFNFERKTSVRGQKELEYNKVDMLLFASYKKSREGMGVYPKNSDGSINTAKKAMNLSYVLYRLKNSTLDWDGKKFINLTGKIGATKGYSIVKFLQKRDVDVSENYSNTGDVKKLIAKRIQGIANQESKIDIYLKNNPKLAQKIEKCKIPLKTKPYYMLFSFKFYKENEKLANKIWDELKNLDSDEKFKSLREKY